MAPRVRGRTPALSIIVPAHDEARVIGRLLGPLVSTAAADELEIVVVANGCTDQTAEVAASFGPPVRVLSIPVASKQEALAAGNRAARGFPRLYVDADVELGPGDVRALGSVLRGPGMLCAGPERTHDMTGSRWPVRWYYDVWERLPEVRRGLFGRGVIGVSETGYARLAARPPVLADDLAASLEFAPGERAIVPGAHVVVHPPRTFTDLLRVRARAAQGTDELERTSGTPDSTARTRSTDLLAIVRRDPRAAPRVALFLLVALLARRRARRDAASGHTGWLRDESSRSVPQPGTSVVTGSPASAPSERRRVKVGKLWVDALTERQAVEAVRAAWALGRGGSIFTVNVDILRAVSRQPELAALLSGGTLVVADGMPLLWAARASGNALPERVTGASLIFSLSEAAAAEGRSVYLLGGAEGVPDRAAAALRSRWADLRVAGSDSPPFGFDQTPAGVTRTITTVAAASPDLVFVGLGFPRQERLIGQLRRVLPHTWFLACGGGIPMAAGVVQRASPAMQGAGLEWAHRLALEPRRLAGRYLRDDLPFAVALLAGSTIHGLAHPGQRHAA